MVLIFGLSENRNRISYQVATQLAQTGCEVIGFGRKEGEVAGVKVVKDIRLITGKVDTITIYMNPENLAPFYDDLIRLNPRRVICNPGAENIDLSNRLSSHGIEVIEACTLVMLRTGQF